MSSQNASDGKLENMLTEGPRVIGLLRSAWSGKSSFLLHHTNERITIYGVTLFKVETSGDSVMVWRMIAWHIPAQLLPIVFIHSPWISIFILF